MPNINLEPIPKNQVRLTITVEPDEYSPYLEEAATRLSQKSTIPGFRPGKAGYEIVKTHLGEMAIYEEALESIIRKTFVEAVLTHQIETVGSPAIDVEKLAPGNAIIFTAIVTRMPAVKELADFKVLRIDAKPIEVKEKDIDQALKDLQRMQTKEIRAATGEVIAKENKVIVSIQIKKDGVAIEGGQSPNHGIYMMEDYYVPGFKEQLIGMKEGEEKTFTLPFPDSHVQKMLAGKPVDFFVKINELYKLEPPQIDDTFAVSLGQKDLLQLKQRIEDNLKDELIVEEERRQEKEILELLAKKSLFEDLPDLLVNEEINKMVGELKGAVEEQGAIFEDYLKNIKKSYAQIKLDFTPQAITRVKVAILLRALAKQEKIEVTQKDIDEELDRLASRYDDPETKKYVYTPQYRDYVEQLLTNRRVISVLKEVMVKH